MNLKTKFQIFAMCLLVVSTTTLRAQEEFKPVNCGATEAMEKFFAANADALKEAIEFQAGSNKREAEKGTKATSFVIPVVFHVYGTTFNGKSVTEAKIIDALNKTNEDFQGLSYDWNSVSSTFSGRKKALDITFKLAQIDPNGNATSGVEFYGTLNGFGNGGGYDSQIQQYAWDNYMYMNVYIQNDLYNNGTTNNSGVAWYPSTSMSNNNTARVVYNGAYIGTNTDENFRRVLTHEFGHWLNLAHTFDNGCSSPGDYVSDTPYTTSNSGSCNYTQQKCSGAGPANGENIMDYTTCYRMFTTGQVSRMQDALNNHGARKTLWTQSNLVATGVASGGDDTQAPSTPTNLQSTGVTSSSISLSWSASSDNVGVTGYDVYRNSSNIGTTSSTSYTATGLSANTSYSFYVRARDAAGNVSGSSSTINVSTADTGPDDGGALTAGVAASGNMDSSDGSDMWYIDVPANATSMQVVLECGSADFDTYGRFNAQPTESTYDWRGYTSGGEDNTVDNPAQGRHYIMVDYYSGSGAYTVTVTVTGGGDTQAPTAPGSLQSTSVTSSSISLSWNASTDNVGVTGYDVYRNSSNIGTTSSTSYTSSGLSASTSYSFYVRAKDAAGNVSGNSNTINVSTSGGGSDDGGALADGVAANGNMDSSDGSDMWYIDVPANSTSLQVVLDAGSADFDTYGRFNAQPTESTYDWRGYTSGGENNTVDNPAQGRHYIMVDYYSGSGAYTLTATITGGGTTNPTYCASSGNSQSYEYIDLVKLGSINRTSGSDGGYVKASNTTSLNPGSSYTMSYSAYISGTYTEHWRVWIDFNRDGDFNDSGETVISNSSTSTGTLTGTVSVPSNASAGKTGMRVSMKYNSAPSSCEAMSYGEVEDYDVTISASGPDASLADASLNISPNPVVDELTVNLTSGDIGKVNVRIVNTNGAVVRNQRISKQAKSIQFKLNLGSLAPGIYGVQVQTAEGILSKTVVKQ